MKRILSALTILLLLAAVNIPAEARRSRKPAAVNRAKREFRGVWIQTAFQDRYMRMSPQQAQDYLTVFLDNLQDCGINAVLFQVRPEGDAFYLSDIEPWSRFLTGTQGKAPNPLWDPMAFMIKLCHERNMEFHAWINPYRMSASKNQVLPQGHLYYQHLDWFVRFDDKLYLNPGMPECRAYVRDVIKDIVGRYDVDALHIDDYFYPYPVPGKTFDDRATFEAYAPVMGFDAGNPEDWGNFRRKSVNILIKSIHDDLRQLKPWVRFGVSPFGIYRNQKSWAEGSMTNGTQCYDDLYADVLLWAEQGWIDYLIPQLYWEVGHKLADYSTLVKWWSQHTPEQCQLYIGQSIERSLDEPAAGKDKRSSDLRYSHKHFEAKLAQAVDCKNVLGQCYWYGYQLDDNMYHSRDFLCQNVYNGAVLPPAYVAIDAIAPEPVKDLGFETTDRGLHLTWKTLSTTDPMQDARCFCIYRFEKGEKVRLDDCSHLIARTPYTEWYDAVLDQPGKYTYVVTALDACNNESLPVRKTLKISKKK